MSRYIIVWVCCLVISQVQAQEVFGGLTLRVDREISQLDGPDINDFFQSYNAYYGSNLETPFSIMRAADFTHNNVGMGIRMGTGRNFGFASGLGMTYGRIRNQNVSVFRNGIGTETELTTRDWTLTFDMGVRIKSILFLQVHMAGRFRKNILEMGYRYQDGSYSLGDEYDILGIYEAPTTTLDLGASAALRIWKLYIPISISWPTNFASDENLLTVTDFEKRQIRWTDLPRDFETWADDPANLDLDNGFVRANSFRSPRVTIGVELIIGKLAPSKE
ncbi:MAG: hypothetical protein AAGI38_10500 [Bacteroidota bacterium]